MKKIVRQLQRMTGNSFILDTCFIIDVFENKININDFQKNKNIYIPSISVGELYYGAFISKLTSSNIAKITNFVFNFPTLSVDIHTSSHYGQIKAALKKKGSPIPENDIWIAALVRQHEAILVTNDNHFQLIPNLTVLSY